MTTNLKKQVSEAEDTMTAVNDMEPADKIVAEGSLTNTGLSNNTLYEWILQSNFTVTAREDSVQRIAPHLSALVRPDDEILDLCCGSGPMSFWFESRGAKVTGVDFAPYMIALARDEASRRNSSVQFVEVDIFTYDLGRERYDLIACFGNSISDFPLSEFAKLVKPVSHALKPKGRFVLQYHDGSYDYMQGTIVREGVYQETPERITFRFEKYLPEIGASVKTMQNEARGESYQRKGYIYTVPVVQLAVSGALELEGHIAVAENHFLDVFVKTGQRRGIRSKVYPRLSVDGRKKVDHKSS